MSEKKQTPAKLQAMIEADRKKRGEAVQDEIDQILQKYQCNLVVRATITDDGRIATGVIVVPAN